MNMISRCICVLLLFCFHLMEWIKTKIFYILPLDIFGFRAMSGTLEVRSVYNQQVVRRNNLA